MSEIEDKIAALKAEIKVDEAKIEEIKSAMWQKKNSLKSLEKALKILLGTEESEKNTDSPGLPLKTVI